MECSVSAGVVAVVQYGVQCECWCCYCSAVWSAVWVLVLLL